MNAIIPRQIREAAAAPGRPLLRVVVVGDVDHDRSTLVGRLLYETGLLSGGAVAGGGIHRFRSRSRDFVLIDAPGDVELLRGMFTGALQADAAILVVDAAEGVGETTRRHGYLLHLLGIRQLVVAINEMDRIAYDAGRFREIETEITAYLQDLGLAPTAIIPVSARDGVGISEHTTTLEWYRPTVIEALDGLAAA